jgi:quinolinate synthase
MALNTLEKLYVALRDLEPRIEIEESLRLAAKKPLDRMLEMAAHTVGQGRCRHPGDRRRPDFLSSSPRKRGPR